MFVRLREMWVCINVQVVHSCSRVSKNMPIVKIVRFLQNNQNNWKPIGGYLKIKVK